MANNGFIKALLGSSTALAALVVALPAMAQQENYPASTNADAADEGLDEIIVTATKREANLQKVSAAITSIGAEALVAQGVSDIRGVQNLVPSVRFQPQNAATEIYLRGVGSTIDLPNIESPTSLNFNGIYIPREVSAVPLFDMAGVEVLLGPQGTLYGRGALGGIVNARFARPTDTNEGTVSAEVGNYSLIHVTGVVNVAASENVSIRGAVDYNNADGFQKSGATSTDNFTGRLSLNIRPTETVSLYVWGLYSKRSGNSANVVAFGVNPLTGAYSPGQFLNSNPYDDRLSAAILALPSNPNLPPPQAPRALQTDGESYITGAELAVEIGDATLTYAPSYLRSKVNVDYFFGGYQTAKFDKTNQWTHELRFSGDAGRISYLAGAYAYRINSAGVFAIAGFPIAVVDQNRLKGVATFGELTFKASDRLRLIIGGRYSHDSRLGVGNFSGFEGANFVFQVPYSYKKSFNHVDYKAAVEYDVAADVMAYAAIQSGNQPGTFNTYRNRPGVTNVVDSADLTAYTAGIKSRLLNGSLQINSEFFYYDYSNLFASAYNVILNTTQTFNAQKTEIYGNQLDILYQPSDKDLFNLTVGYLHARNKKFVLPDNSANFNGLQLQYAPDWTISAGYHHDFALASGYLRAKVNTRFESSYFSDFSHVPGGRQSSYTKTDASLTYFADDNKWNVGVWIKNIENEPVLAATAVGSNSPFQLLGATSNLEPPRTFGVRASINF